MRNIKINKISADFFLGKFCVNAEFYLKNKKLKVPEDFSYEKTLFLICAAAPLFQFFFSPQRFEDSYSAWVKKKLFSFPKPFQSEKPSDYEKKIFLSEIASNEDLNKFLKGGKEIDLKNYLSMASYRAQKNKILSKAVKKIKDSLGKDLVKDLKNGLIFFSPKEAFDFWKKISQDKNYFGKYLREAFIDGDYPYLLEDKDFFYFLLSVKDISLNSELCDKIYDCLKKRFFSFKGDEEQKLLGALSEGILSKYKKELRDFSSKEDLIYMFNLKDIGLFKYYLKNILSDLAAFEDRFFYVSDFPAEKDSEFAGLDEKLEFIVGAINEKYSEDTAISDLWEDREFRFLFLTAAFWFKMCWNEFSKVS